MMELKKRFEQICKDIKSLKIQGSENVARASLNALLIKNDKISFKRLINLRPTEPALRNVLKHALSFSDIQVGVKKTLFLMDDARTKVVSNGSQLIKDGMTVFTHCHSSTVLDILKTAKSQGKKFQVFNTETRPNFQGRITAAELAKSKIPVKMFIDSAATSAIRESDLFLFGVDVITAEGNVVNKIGNKMFAEVAEKYDVPSYACSIAFKFDPETLNGKTPVLEERNPDEVWKERPKGVKISNIVFEIIEAKLITGIVSELGILPPEALATEVKKRYPWLMR